MVKPAVSVLIPVYNVEDYLERCLESILSQTLKDIEIICVNDGSTDSSLDILKQYQKKDTRIIIVNKENGGLPSARNAGLDKARGKYVGFVDSDDYVEPNMFNRLLEVAEKDNSDIVICGANIFPEEPKADSWLYACLSPEYKKYDKFESSLLFDNIAATPFLWRTFIKKDIIDKDHLRLQEDIVVGEDKAFQFKVYPRAQAITVIPDKLYNYFWCREGSLMDQIVYSDYDKKVWEHARLIEHIAGNINNVTKEMDHSFLVWSIPFIYNDYIFVSLEKRIKMADMLLNTWYKCGFLEYKASLPGYVQDMVRYIQQISEETIIKPRLSIVIPVDIEEKYLNEALDSILNQSLKELEIIIINNGTQHEHYTIIYKYMIKDKRIRVMNMSHSSYADALNKGIVLAKGLYIAFLDGTDWYKDENVLNTWLNVIEKNDSDICGSIYCKKDMKQAFSGEYRYVDLSNDPLSKFVESDFHNMIYSMQFIREKKLLFNNGSILTGFEFLIKSCFAAASREWYDDVVCIHRRMHKMDWISTEKCKNILKILEELLELSIEKRNAHLHIKILEMINGDYLGKIIINNTRAFIGSASEFPNGENSQVEVVSSLMKLASLIDPDLLDGNISLSNPQYIQTLYSVIKERQLFLTRLTVI